MRKIILALLFLSILVLPAYAASYTYDSVSVSSQSRYYLLENEEVAYSKEGYLISDNVVSVNGTIVEQLTKSGSINLFLFNINNGVIYFIYGNYEGTVTDARDQKMPIMPGTYAIEAIVYADGGNNRADVAFRNINVTSENVQQNATMRDFLLDVNMIDASSVGAIALQKDDEYFDDGGC